MRGYRGRYGRRQSESQEQETKQPPTYEQARDYAFRSLACKQQTESQMREKLERKGCTPEVLGKVMNMLKSYGFIDDENYMEAYVATHCHRLNRQKLRERFYTRGLRDTEQLDRLLETYDYDEEALLSKEMDKYFRSHDLTDFSTDPKARQRMVAYFIRRGYPYDSVQRQYQQRLDTPYHKV